MPLAILLTFGGAVAVLARPVGDRIPPGVTVGGVDVAGMSDDEARAAIAARARQVARGSVRLEATEVPGFEITTDGATLGARPDIEGILREARSRRSLGGRILARLQIASTIDVPIRFTLSDVTASAAVRAVARRLDRPARGAGVRPADGAFRVTAPRSGREVDQGALRAALEELPARIDVPIRMTPPPITKEEAQRARDVATAAVAAEKRVTLQGASVTLRPAVLRSAIRFRARPPELQVRLDEDTLAGPVRRGFGPYERKPRDAGFRVTGTTVKIVPQRAGRKFDFATLSRTIVNRPKRATHPLRVVSVKPSRTVADVRKLRITELISEFTTPYSCCPPRVTNIKRGAQILDGTIIPAGGTFSLNDELGERTADRGFVEAPMIEAGRLTDAVGGGVSQIATTIFNAAFFGGMELVSHTPHEFYISRYPRGREATVSWRSPELIFRNDWSAAVLVKMTATDSGITVRFFSSKLGRRVESTSGEPYAFTEAKTREIPRSDLEPGDREVVQSGGIQGFTIEYTRKVFQNDDEKRSETFRWRYKPEDTIIEVGPDRPADEPDESQEPGTGTTTDGETPSGTTTGEGPPAAPSPPAPSSSTAPPAPLGAAPGPTPEGWARSDSEPRSPLRRPADHR